MSVRVMSEVWERSRQEGTALLMLLALADFANDDGVCWPSVTRLAHKCRLGKRQAQNLLRKLEEEGEIERLDMGGGRGHTSTYRVKCAAPFGERVQSGTEKGAIQREEKAQSAAPFERERVQPAAPEPSLSTNRHLEPSEESPKRSRPDGRAKPPAVELCKRVLHRYPHKSIWGSIDRIVGRDFKSLLTWGRLMRLWRMAGNNPTNFAGMLDRYEGDRRRRARDPTDPGSEEFRRRYVEGEYAEFVEH